MKITIGAFILQQLRTLNIDRIYGVPGDYNLALLELIEHDSNIEFIGNCNELNASYAADGYARLKGAGALITTYGVGDLAALSGIAGAYAESAPVVCLAGTPPLHAMKNHELLHHTLADGNFDNVMNCFKQFTVAQALITPENAAMEILALFPVPGRKRNRFIYSYLLIFVMWKLKSLRQWSRRNCQPATNIMSSWRPWHCWRE